MTKTAKIDSNASSSDYTDARFDTFDKSNRGDNSRNKPDQSDQSNQPDQPDILATSVPPLFCAEQPIRSALFNRVCFLPLVACVCCARVLRAHGLLVNTPYAGNLRPTPVCSVAASRLAAYCPSECSIYVRVSVRVRGRLCDVAAHSGPCAHPCIS
jgi:hypothetical protein